MLEEEQYTQEYDYPQDHSGDEHNHVAEENHEDNLNGGDNDHDDRVKKDTSPFLNDNDITNFIRDVGNNREKEIQEKFTDKYINSIGFDTSLLLSAVKVISEAPTSNQLREIVQESNDKKLFYQLQNPDASLGIFLKDQTENADFDVFEKILSFKKKEGLNIKEHDKIATFVNESQYWIPPIIEIDDEDIPKQIWANTDLDNLAYLGKCYYDRVVNEYLIQRFDDRNLKLLSYHTTNKRIFKEWAFHYDMPVDGSYSADQVFLAYLGGLVSSIPYNDKEYEQNLRIWITILLEPLLLQFESSDPLKFNAIGDLKEILKGDLKFEILFESKHENPQFLVHIVAGDHILSGSTRSANAVFDAQTKSSSAVLYNPILKQLAIDLTEQSRISKQHSPSPTSNVMPNQASAQQQPQRQPIPQPQPVPQPGQPGVFGRPQPQPMSQPIPQPQPQMGPGGHYQPSQGGPPVPQPQVSAAQQHQPLPSQNQQFVVANAGMGGNQVQPVDPGPTYPQAVVNEEYQRLQTEAELDILEAPIVEDERSIDSSSKEKLNQMLVKRRIGTAEYKTAKLNNSDVQVTCYIENAPIAKATSTTKKRAGHIVAQYILNYPEYFLHRFKGRI